MTIKPFNVQMIEITPSKIDTNSIFPNWMKTKPASIKANHVYSFDAIKNAH